MSNIKSSFLGFIVGDALGVPLEFKSRQQLMTNPTTEMIGYGSHNVPAGTWSDDTSMTLAEVDSIQEYGSINYNDIMDKYMEWVKNSKYTSTGVFFDIGIATRNALNRYMSNVDPLLCGGTDIRDNGNGSLMRILPFVFYAYVNELSGEEAIELINKASSLTHGHEISKIGCNIYANYIFNLLNGLSKEEAFNKITIDDYKSHYSDENLSYYKRIFDKSLMNANIDSIKSSGFVVDSLEASIWNLLYYDNFKDTVVSAVNMGDDTDTVGAITGSLAGLLYGEDSIPGEWLSKINNLQFADDLINKYINKISNLKQK